MTMKLSAIVTPEFTNAVVRLLQQEIPGRAAFKLRGIVQALEKEAAKYNETRLEILKRNADKDEKGNPIIEKRVIRDEQGKPIMEREVFKLSDEAEEKVRSEMEDMDSIDIEHGTISLNELGDKFQISGQDVMLLNDIITE